MSLSRRSASKVKTLDLVYTGLSAALLCVGSLFVIPIPGGIPLTLQTMIIFMVVRLLGLWRGLGAVVLYLCIGGFGAPVFAGGNGGWGVLLGSSGGYLWGFLPAVLVTGMMLHRWGKTIGHTVLAMLAGQLMCYLVGTVWFGTMYAAQTGDGGIGSILLVCVLPYLMPDIIKILLAAFLSERLKKIVKQAHP